jgi:allantoicase
VPDPPAVPDALALPDLAARTFGGAVLWADDETFAGRENLVSPGPATFTPRTFGAKGQVYDGWETRRRRDLGPDACDRAVVRLGAPGLVRAVVVDTSHFTGNFPASASVEAVTVDGHPTTDELRGADWRSLVTRSALQGDTAHTFTVEDSRRVTHVRLTIYPDGGVARLRVHGDVVPDPSLLPEVFDVAALTSGGHVTGCSNMFYGRPHNMLYPGLARHMGDGWETARRRTDGNEWAEITLAAPTQVEFVDLDTTHFKGNCPGSASLRGSLAGGPWFDILPAAPLTADTPHRFPVRPPGPADRVRLDIIPDGGMARLRVIGRPDRTVLEENFRRHVESR